MPIRPDVRAALVAIVAAAALAIVPVAASAGAFLHVDCGDRDPHRPIRIVGDAAFRLGPAVGVRNPTAAGTADDPYVIAGWCIVPDPTPTAGAGIALHDTVAHVVVEDNLVDGHPADVPFTGREDQPSGIRLEDADHVTVQGNEIAGNGFAGVEADLADDAVVRDNAITGNGFAGVDLVDSHGATVAGNVLQGNGDGIHLSGARRATVVANTVAADDEALVLFDASRATIRDNALGSGGLTVAGDRQVHYEHEIAASNTVNGEPVRYVRDRVGVDVAAPAGQVILVNTTDARVTGLDLSGTTVGVQLAFTEGTVVANSTVADDDIGVALDDVGGESISCDGDDGFGFEGPDGAEIENSTIRRNRVGVDLDDATGIHLHDNDLDGNAEAALDLDDGSDVDARDNWWGAASGPSGGAEDACTGTVADGDGDTVDAEAGAMVRFDPWRDAPSPDAGVG